MAKRFMKKWKKSLAGIMSMALLLASCYVVPVGATGTDGVQGGKTLRRHMNLMQQHRFL